MSPSPWKTFCDRSIQLPPSNRAGWRDAGRTPRRTVAATRKRLATNDADRPLWMTHARKERGSKSIATNTQGNGRAGWRPFGSQPPESFGN